jgi:glucose-1-phosphate adenylyltransferase
MAIPPVCMILAGGKGTRLNALAWQRAKPAVPFAGIYRLIDFTLSNAMNSGIMRIGVLTQYRPLSLMEHIGTGSSWDLSARTRMCRILPPAEGVSAKDWYKGTAHAILMNKDFVYQGDEKDVLILSGDHIYHMDYRPMIQFHQQRKSVFTIATMSVPLREASRFGIAVTDSENRVVEFQEKPQIPKNNLGSMGIYLADRDVVMKMIMELEKEGKNDIGAHLVPALVPEGRVYAFPFDGYWRDVGTLESYWQSSMDFLYPERNNVDMHRWNMRTNMETTELCLRPPARFDKSAFVTQSLISQGCRINGKVYRSILSPGVFVGRGAEVTDSIILDDTIIEGNCRVHHTIADKNVHIYKNAELFPTDSNTPNELFPEHLTSGLILLGKDSRIPEETKIGSNCLVHPCVKNTDWTCKELNPGGTIEKQHTSKEH